MPPVNDPYYAGPIFTYGQLMNVVRSYFKSWAINQYHNGAELALPDVELSTDYGRRVMGVWSGEPSEGRAKYVFAPQGASQIVPARMAVMDPQFCGVTHAYYEVAGETWQGWPWFSDGWANLVVSTQRLLVETWTDGDVTNESGVDMYDQSVPTANRLNVAVLKNDNEALHYFEQLQGFTDNAISDATYLKFVTPTVQNPVGPPTLTADLTDLVKAVKKIGSGEQRVSFNHGGLIYNMSTNDIIE